MVEVLKEFISAHVEGGVSAAGTVPRSVVFCASQAPSLARIEGQFREMGVAEVCPAVLAPAVTGSVNRYLDCRKLIIVHCAAHAAMICRSINCRNLLIVSIAEAMLIESYSGVLGHFER